MHTRKERRKVAKWLRAKAAYFAHSGHVEKRKPSVKYPIPVVTEVEPERLTPRFWRYGGTSSAKGKDGSGRSKWFARVLAGKAGRVAA